MMGLEQQEQRLQHTPNILLQQQPQGQRPLRFLDIPPKRSPSDLLKQKGSVPMNNIHMQQQEEAQAQAYTLRMSLTANLPNPPLVRATVDFVPPAMPTINFNGNQVFSQADERARQGNHALQDFKMQLLLLEQQNKKRRLMARQEQATQGLSEPQRSPHQEFPSLSSSESSFTTPPAEDRVFSHQYTRQLSTSPPPFSVASSSRYPAPNTVAYTMPYSTKSPYHSIPTTLTPSMKSEYYAEEELSPFGVGYAAQMTIVRKKAMCARDNSTLDERDSIDPDSGKSTAEMPTENAPKPFEQSQDIEHPADSSTVDTNHADIDDHDDIQRVKINIHSEMEIDHGGAVVDSNKHRRVSIEAGPDADQVAAREARTGGATAAMTEPTITTYRRTERERDWGIPAFSNGGGYTTVRRYKIPEPSLERDTYESDLPLVVRPDGHSQDRPPSYGSRSRRNSPKSEPCLEEYGGDPIYTDPPRGRARDRRRRDSSSSLDSRRRRSRSESRTRSVSEIVAVAGDAASLLVRQHRRRQDGALGSGTYNNRPGSRSPFLGQRARHLTKIGPLGHLAGIGALAYASGRNRDSTTIVKEQRSRSRSRRSHLRRKRSRSTSVAVIDVMGRNDRTKRCRLQSTSHSRSQSRSDSVTLADASTAEGDGRDIVDILLEQWTVPVS